MKLIIIISIVVVLLMIIIGVGFVIKNNGKETYEIIEDDTSQEVKKDSKKTELKKKNKSSKKTKKEEIVRDSSLTYYDTYEMSIKEKILWSLVGMVVVFLVGMIFYNNVIWALVLSLIGLYYPKIKTKEIIRKRKSILLLQFKEMLYSLSSSLSSGRSVENAFKDVTSEMAMLFERGKNNLILPELEIINKKLEVNETIEDALNSFAERSMIEEIETFADVFTISTRVGGDLKKTINDSSKMIGDKITVKQEIETIVSGKKFESAILTVIPILLIFIMKFMAPDMIKSLYSSFGRIMSTVAIIIIAIASLWAKKIVEIEV
ncbi:MAG: type II secretion system F family protein [Clostridium sp.]|nr:type II secretion system F family protein [Clostridium sp.]